MPRNILAIRPSHVVRLAIIFVLLFTATPTFSQSSSEGLSRPGSGSAGGAIFWDVSGDLERTGTIETAVGPLGFLYGTVFVTPRIAIGAEYSTLGNEDHVGTIESFGDITVNYGGSAIYGVARVRIIRRALVNVDAVGGIGGQFSHQGYEIRPTSGTASSYEANKHYLSYLTGADVPIAVAQHVIVAPFTRFYFLRGMAKYPDDSPSWQTAIGVGATAAFKW